MAAPLARARSGISRTAKPLSAAAIGALTVGLLRATRYFDADRTADALARIARTIGPLLREQRIGRANLTAAFPEKSPAEIEEILAGVWDNLGRMGAEFAHLDHIWDFGEEYPEDGRIELAPGTRALFHKLRLDGKPALIFASHLANWELPALAAVAHGLDAAILYRKPNIPSADRIIQETLARLLRQVECPVHGVRVIRLPGRRFRAELSEEVVPVRDEKGQIDIQGTTQAITSVVEGWIREHPEQWLWLHRRWR